MAYLVSLADFTDNVLLGNLDVVKSELTSGRRLDTELKVSVILTSIADLPSSPSW